MRAVAVLERMDIDKSEGRGRGDQHRVDAVVTHAVVRLQQTAHEVAEIIRPCANEFRERIAVLIPFAQKDAVGTQAHKHESRVLDKDAVKSDDFLERERVLSRLLDSATPSLEAVARRTLALDLETGLAVGQQHEAGGAGYQMSARAPHGFPRPGRDVERQELRESSGTPDDRTEPAGAQKIVAHAVPFRKARFPGKVCLGVEKIDSRRCGRVVHVKGASRQDFVEIPDPARQDAGRRGVDKALDLSRRHGFKDPLQRQQIDFFVAEGERDMAGKTIAGPVTFIKDGPRSYLCNTGLGL
jgi:hypothetical protein